MGVSGHCLCGEVRYRVDHEIGLVVNCHCSFCRRAHGAPFVPISLVDKTAFHFTAGEEHTRIFDTPGGGARCFCQLCGTRICNYPRVMPDQLSLLVETLDEGIDQAPSLHINVESKASWYEIADEQPQFDALPKGPTRASEKQP